jgi:signal transduction histidine kinase
VQEALTNTLKHAPSAMARVRVRYGLDRLEIVVTDGAGDGSPAGLPALSGVSAAGQSAGHGLVGMRERVAMFGGSVHAGPSDDGFTVSAWFPLSTREDDS